MLKSLYRIDRGTFWLWAVPIVFVHGLFGVAAAYNVQTSLGAVDTGLIVVMAMALAGRFRDIGWPVWIGPTFMLGTMLVLPMALLFFMISMGTAGSAFMPGLTVISRFSGLGNIVLLLLAGCVPGRSPPPSQPAGDDPSGGLDVTQLPTSFEKLRRGTAAALEFGVGGIVALLLIAAIVGILRAGKGPNAEVGAASAATTSPAANAYGKNVLTKETNDFLRDLAKRSPSSLK
jgi:hypothetical protein